MKDFISKEDHNAEYEMPEITISITATHTRCGRNVVTRVIREALMDLNYDVDVEVVWEGVKNPKLSRAFLSPIKDSNNHKEPRAKIKIVKE